MTLVLGIDTSTDTCAVGLADENGWLADSRFAGKNRQVERITFCIESMLQDAGVSESDISGIAVSLGPGSFTGLRIGLGVAKGLSYGWGKPLMGVPSGEVLLVHAPSFPSACVITVARKDALYLGLYAGEKDGWALQDLRLAGWSELPLLLPNREFLCIGSAVLRFRRELGAVSENARFLPEPFNRPFGHAVAELGIRLLKAGQLSDPESLSPLYVQRFQGIE